jgi:uncharacterized protein (TIGR03437 family)
MVQRLPSITVIRYAPSTGIVRLGAKVMATGGTPTGTVQIVEAASQTVLGTMPLNSSEVFMGLRPDRIKPGMKLQAVYSGDSTFAASNSQVLTAAPVENAASYSTAPLAPDAIATIFGTSYVSQAAGSDSGSDSTASEATLAQPTVRIVDSAGAEFSAVVFFASPNQINFLVPPAIAMGPALVTVTDTTGIVSLGSFTVARVAPGIFSANSTGEGAGSAWMIHVNNDGSQDPRVNVATYDYGKQMFVPAQLTLDPETGKMFLEVYVTGIRHGSAITFSMNGQNVPTLYTGAHGQFPGLDQINVEIPASLKGAGEISLRMTADGVASNVVTVVIQ